MTAVALNTSTTSSPVIAQAKSLIEQLPDITSAFQKKEGEFVTSNCQYIQRDKMHFYGIHKNDQMFQKDGVDQILPTILRYKELKSHILQKMDLPPDFPVVQVVGDSAAFSDQGTALAKEFLRRHLPDHAVILYGYTGHAETDGTRCVNAAVSDVVVERDLQNHTVANLVGFHTPTALKQWGCSGPGLQHYVLVYGDDETCRERGTVFGDDVTTSDFFADKLLVLDGGAQSFRQVCNALLLDQKIEVLSGLRTTARGLAPDSTPFFSASKFLADLNTLISKKGSDISEDELQSWYCQYFGAGRCYVGDPRKPDFDTKQKLMDAAWNLLVKNKLYLKIQIQTLFSSL